MMHVALPGRCRMVGALFLSLTLLATPTQAQTMSLPDDEVPRNPRSWELAALLYELSDGGAIRHEQYDGWIRRLDPAGKEVVRTRVPKAGMIARSTTLVFSADRSRFLMIHSGDDHDFRPGHRTTLFDVERLKAISDLPLGKCDGAGGRLPVRTAHLTLLCHHSQNPQQPKDPRTLALVTVDLKTGALVRWFSLGARRSGSWFGPMFFGYTYDAHVVFADRLRPVGAPEVSPRGTPVASKYPWSVIVVRRYDEDQRGEVWGVPRELTVPPFLIARLSHPPIDAKVYYGERTLLHVTVEVVPGAPPKIHGPQGPPPVLELQVLDLATGEFVR